eukprot:CAMPEP_0202389678 /NCGR_PEP_ID=MMETSP1127-20130417/84480_1 /ASSEMBLY_ACC=CAM_ASM_000462 /TAXON_ID=3047 /ORGANISM="Dunaliella tertiolecta, Strain CCMP1320" /LENGTH=146 /DNA_ID=CAMNT_0048991523 /DNA_START=48 /DNA_END=485 /DNA_ORIENTATION=+
MKGVGSLKSMLGRPSHPNNKRNRDQAEQDENKLSNVKQPRFGKGSSMPYSFKQGQSAQVPNKPHSSHPNTKEKPSTGKSKGTQAATKWDWSKNCPASSSKAQQVSPSVSKSRSGGERTPVTTPLKNLNSKTTPLPSSQSPYPKDAF